MEVSGVARDHRIAVHFNGHGIVRAGEDVGFAGRGDGGVLVERVAPVGGGRFIGRGARRAGNPVAHSVIVVSETQAGDKLGGDGLLDGPGHFGAAVVAVFPERPILSAGVFPAVARDFVCHLEMSP